MVLGSRICRAKYFNDLCLAFSIPKINEKLKEDSPTKLFRTLRWKIFDGKSRHNPLKQNIFRYPKIMRLQKVPIRNCLALRQKFFDRKMCYSLPPLCHEFFGYHFVTDRRVHLRIFPVLWDNNFSKQSRDIPLLGIKFFDTRHILKHRRAPLRKFSAVWDKKNWQIEILLLSKKIRQQNISEIQGSPNETFRYLDKVAFLDKM